MFNRTIILLLFIVLGINSYSQIKIIYPDNNSVLMDSSVIFGWNKTSDNEIFDLQISTDNIFATLIFNASLTTFDTLLLLNNNQKYFWRVRSDIETQWSDTFNLTLFNIKSIDSLHLWFNADYLSTYNDGDSIDTWADSSKSSLNLLQSNSMKMPKLRKNVDSLNNHNTVAFDGINDYLKFTDTVVVSQPINYFFFTHPHLIAGDIFDGGAFIQQFGRFSLSKTYIYAGSYLTGQEILISNNYYIFNFQFNSPISKLYINNNLDAVGNNGLQSTTGLTIGSLASGGNSCNIDIAEVIVIKDSIPDSLRTIIHDYLRYKYAPPANLGYNINIPHSFCDTTIDAGARFTDYLWNTGDTTQTITVNQGGQYAVTVTDIFGFQSSDSLIVYYPEPFQLKDTLICYGDTILWETNLSNTNYTYLWQDNSIDSILPIFSQGDYYVQITDTLGCIYNSDTINIQINNYPITTTLGNDTTFCAGQALYLQTGNNETVSYNWSNLDSSDFIIINNPNNYSVTVTDTLGCVAIDTINIQINGQAPTTGFYYVNTCLNDNTIFTDTSFTTDGSSIVSWNWDFANGNTSISQNPQLQFADTGNYQISLTVTTDSSCSNTIVKNIKVYPLPIPDFNFSNLCSGNDLYFEDNSTIINDTIVLWLWNFENGFTSTDTNTTTVFDTSGNFAVTLRTTSINNCVDSITKNLFIKQSPHPDFTVSNTCVGKLTSFYNLTSDEGIWTIISQIWDFGNGDSSIFVNPTIIFNNDTTYQVSLSAKLNNGCSSTITKDILIYSNPFVDFSVGNICVDNLTSFTDISTSDNNIVSWLWKIDTVFSSQNQNVDVLFENSGNISVNLMVVTNVGCDSSKSKYLTVNPLPTVDFNTSTEIGVAPLYIEFSAIEKSTSFIWNLGDNNFEFDSLINHTYEDSGLYKVTLIQETEFGCKDSTHKFIKAVIPVIDLAVFSSNLDIDNKSMSLSTKLINFGTLPVNKIELFLNLDNGSTIKEIWEGTLFSGEILEYKFTSIYELSENQTPEFICITANPIFDIYSDKNMDNNEECLSVNNIFNLLQPYPNPASGSVYFHFISPSSENVVITIINSKGEKVKEYTELSKKGYNKFNFLLNNLAKGNYSVSVKFMEDTQTKKFIIY